MHRKTCSSVFQSQSRRNEGIFFYMKNMGVSESGESHTDKVCETATFCLLTRKRMLFIEKNMEVFSNILLGLTSLMAQIQLLQIVIIVIRTSSLPPSQKKSCFHQKKHIKSDKSDLKSISLSKIPALS